MLYARNNIFRQHLFQFLLNTKMFFVFLYILLKKGERYTNDSPLKNVLETFLRNFITAEKNLLRVFDYQIGMGMSKFVCCFIHLGRLCLYIHNKDVLPQNMFSSKFCKIHKETLSLFLIKLQPLACNFI